MKNNIFFKLAVIIFSISMSFLACDQIVGNDSKNKSSNNTEEAYTLTVNVTEPVVIGESVHAHVFPAGTINETVNEKDEIVDYSNNIIVSGDASNNQDSEAGDTSADIIDDPIEVTFINTEINTDNDTDSNNTANSNSESSLDGNIDNTTEENVPVETDPTSPFLFSEGLYDLLVVLGGGDGTIDDCDKAFIIKNVPVLRDYILSLSSSDFDLLINTGGSECLFE